MWNTPTRYYENGKDRKLSLSTLVQALEQIVKHFVLFYKSTDVTGP